MFVGQLVCAEKLGSERGKTTQGTEGTEPFSCFFTSLYCKLLIQSLCRIKGSVKLLGEN